MEYACLISRRPQWHNFLSLVWPLHGCQAIPYFLADGPELFHWNPQWRNYAHSVLNAHPDSHHSAFSLLSVSQCSGVSPQAWYRLVSLQLFLLYSVMNMTLFCWLVDMIENKSNEREKISSRSLFWPAVHFSHSTCNPPTRLFFSWMLLLLALLQFEMDQRQKYTDCYIHIISTNTILYRWIYTAEDGKVTICIPLSLWKSLNCFFAFHCCFPIQYFFPDL